jgi:hypothetical protein
MHANWQARILVELAGPAEAARLRLAGAHFANRVIGDVTPPLDFTSNLIIEQ